MQNIQKQPFTVAAAMEPDETLQRETQRLYRLAVYGRWIFVLVLWLTVGSLSLWQLRFRIQLLLDYFTWSAVKYGLAYHQVSAFGLFLCVGVTTSVIVWQARNWLFGLPKSEAVRFQQQVLRIRQQGHTHPLWHWVCGEKPRF
ncbi:MAG: hypothetical protein WCD18_08445 [Thermosynechococcaceae cyanobacterium]